MVEGSNRPSKGAATYLMNPDGTSATWWDIQADECYLIVKGSINPHAAR